MDSFSPTRIFPQMFACLFRSHIEPCKLKQRSKTNVGHTKPVTCNVEVLKKSCVVDTGVFLNVMKRIIHRGLSLIIDGAVVLDAPQTYGNMKIDLKPD